MLRTVGYILFVLTGIFSLFVIVSFFQVDDGVIDVEAPEVA